MAAVVGSLLAELGVDKSGLTSGLRAAGIDITNFENKTSRQFQRMDRNTSARFAAMGGAAGRFAKVGLGAVTVAATAALAPILSLAGALGGAKAAMAEFSKTADVSQRLGVSAERLQELRFAAEQSGMAMDNFDVAFRRFIRRSSEAAKGTGAAKDAFKELGIQLRDNEGRLKDSDKLLKEVADKLQQVKNPADKLRLAFKLFDTDGSAMVNVLAQGSQGLDDFAQKARDLGIVVDEHIIKRSQELQTEFETATRILDLQFKVALINLAPIMVGIAERAARLAGDIRGLIDSMRDLENQGSQSLDGRMRSLGMERIDIENKILKLQEEQRTNQGIYAQHENRMLDGTISALRDQMAALSEEEAKILKILEGRKKPVLSPIDEGSPIDYGSGGGSRNKAAEAALKEAEAVRDLIANLEHERAMIGLTDAEKRKLTELRRVGSAATAEEKAQIEGLIDAIDRETAALTENQKQQEQRQQAMENLFEMGGEALLSIVDGSERAEDALKKLIIQLAKAALQAALLGSGPLAGLFGGGGGILGGLFGGGAPLTNLPLGVGLYDEGGYTGSGGKNDPAGIVHKGEVVWSQEDVRRVGGPRAAEMLRRTLPKLPSFSKGGAVGKSGFVPPMLDPNVFTQHSVAGGVGA